LFIGKGATHAGMKLGLTADVRGLRRRIQSEQRLEFDASGVEMHIGVVRSLDADGAMPLDRGLCHFRIESDVCRLVANRSLELDAANGLLLCLDLRRGQGSVDLGGFRSTVTRRIEVDSASHMHIASLNVLQLFHADVIGMKLELELF